MKKSLVAITAVSVGFLGLATPSSAAPGDHAPKSYESCTVVEVEAIEATRSSIEVDGRTAQVVPRGFDRSGERRATARRNDPPRRILVCFPETDDAIEVDDTLIDEPVDAAVTEPVDSPDSATEDGTTGRGDSSTDVVNY